MTHILAVSILCQALVNLLMLLLLYLRIDHIPETNSAVRRAGYELGEALFILASHVRHCLLV